MKKYALLLIGMCALALSSVLFVACEKNSNKLVGKWKLTERGDVVTIVFNKDNTGVQTDYVSYYDETYTQDFDYTYDAQTDILKMQITYYEGGRREIYTEQFKVDWYGNDKIYFMFYEPGYGYDDDAWGPFIRQ